jgi:hypothetical protein
MSIASGVTSSTSPIYTFFIICSMLYLVNLCIGESITLYSSDQCTVPTVNHNLLSTVLTLTSSPWFKPSGATSNPLPSLILGRAFQATPRSLGNKKNGYRVMMNMSVSVDDMVPRLAPLHANRISRASSLASRPRLVKGVQGLSIVDASVICNYSTGV